MDDDAFTDDASEDGRALGGRDLDALKATP
jgi:hypothetical protein